MFVNYVENLVEQINKGALPNLELTYTYMCRAKCMRTIDEAFNNFKAKFNDKIKLPASDKTLQTILETASQEALKFYDANMIGEEGLDYKKKLESQITHFRKETIRLNEAKTISIVKEFLAQTYESF